MKNKFMKATLTSLAVILLTSVGGEAAQQNFKVDSASAKEAAALQAKMEAARKAAAEKKTLAEVKKKEQAKLATAQQTVEEKRKQEIYTQREANIEEQAKIWVQRELGAQLAKSIARAVIERGDNPLNVLLPHLQQNPILVEGRDITRDVAENVTIRGLSLPQATRRAKVDKRAEILGARGYGFSAQDIIALAEEMENGRTLEEAIRAKAPVVFCAGIAIQRDVVAQMIAQNITFDVALERVSIDTHLNKLRLVNIQRNLGLTEPVLLNIAQRVSRKQSPTYQAALVEALGPILFQFDGLQINITPQVAPLVFQNDIPGLSHNAACETVKLALVKERYTQKNLGLSPQELDALSRAIVVQNQTALQAITTCLSLNPETHRGQQLTDKLAQALATNNPKASALAEIKTQIDRDYLTGLKIGLSDQQIQRAVASLRQGLSDAGAVANTLTMVFCKGTDLTEEVARRMIAAKETYAVAVKDRKLQFFTNYFQGCTVLDNPTIVLLATRMEQNDGLSYVAALSAHLPTVKYEANDLGYGIAAEMLRKVSFEQAKKKVWVDAATQDISTKHPMLKDLALALAQAMFASNITKVQALEAHIKTLPCSAHTQGKAAAVAQAVLSKNETVETAWHNVCVKPKILELAVAHKNFDPDALTYVAGSMMLKGYSVEDALNDYLVFNKTSGSYCKKPAIINFMLKDNLPLQEALLKAETDAVRTLLTHAKGWSCLEPTQLNNLIQHCLTCDSIEEAEETFLLSICQQVPTNLWKAFVRLAKSARVPLKQFEADYFANVVIPDRLRKEHPNLNDEGIIKYIAHKLARENKFDGALDVATLKEALQGLYPFSKEGITGVEIIEKAGKMAAKLIADKRLPVGEALGAVHIDDRAIILHNGQLNHLSLEECQQIATIMIRTRNNDVGQVLKLVFQAKKYNDDQELDQIVKAILVQGKTFKQAEELFGFRKLMTEDPRLQEEDARKIALFIRQGLDRDAAYKRFMKEKFALKDAQAANLCHKLYFEKGDAMEVAAERAGFVATTAQNLKGKPFYPLEVPEDAVWKVARKTLKNERDVIKGMGLYLLKAYPAGVPHLSPEAYELLKEDYFTSMAKAILAEGGNVSIGDFTALAWNNFEEFEQQLLGQVSLYVTGNQWLRMHNDLEGDWKQIFGEAHVSLPTIAAIMMYKFGFHKDNIGDGRGDHALLKGGLLKAVPVFLQHIKPNEAKLKLVCLGAGNPVNCIIEDEAVAPLCVGFYGAVAGDMIQNKRRYDAAVFNLRGVVQEKERIISGNYKYLDVRGSSYIQEISEAEVFGQMDRKPKAIYRFLTTELAGLERKLTILGKDPTALDEFEQKNYLEYVADNLSCRSGESLEVVCYNFRGQYEDQLQKLRAKMKGKLNFLTAEDCQVLLWNIRIVRTAPEEALLGLLGQKAATGECQLPAFMLSSAFVKMPDITPLSGKRRGAFNKLVNALKFSLDTELPRTYEEAIQAALLSHFQQNLMNEKIQLPKSMLQPLAAKLAAVIWDARATPVDQQLERVRREKQAVVRGLLQRKVLASKEQIYLEEVTQKMLTSPSPVLCALLEARSADLMKGSDRKGLTPEMFELWVKLVAFQERGIISDNVSIVNVQLTQILARALDFKRRIEGGEGLIEPDYIEEEGFDPKKDMSPLKLDLATYYLAKKNAKAVERKLLLEGVQPLQESICLSNLRLLDLQPAHFGCHLDLSRDLDRVAKSRSIQLCADLLALDPGTIGTLYRRDNNIIPIFVGDNEKKMLMESRAAKAKLKQQRETFERDMGIISIEAWRQEAFKPWNKHPNNPKYLTSVQESVKTFSNQQVGKPIRINIENLQFDPWYAPTYYDGLPLVTVEVYEGFRNEIVRRVKAHMDRKEMLDNGYRGKLWCIGRFFAWGDTRDKYTGLGGDPYLTPGPRILGGEDCFKSAEMELWRKRVKVIYENVLFKNAPTDEEVFDRSVYLYAPEIRACDNATKDALLKYEQMMPPLDKLTLFSKVAHCLNMWKVGTLDILVRRNLKARVGIETEYGRFMRILCRRTLSAQTLETDISYHSQLDIYDSKDEVDHRNGLSIKPFILEYLTAYQNEICVLIKQNIEFKVRPDVATHVIYQEDIFEWARLHPKYCNVLEEDLLTELTVDGAGKEVKDVVVHRLLSHTGYIDWEDREK